MRKYLLTTLILFMFAGAGFAFSDPADFTGESYFGAPLEDLAAPAEEKSSGSSHKTIPPLKLLRLKTKHYFATSDERKEARAKRKAIKQALKDYKKNKVLEDATIVDVPTDADIEHLEMGGIEESKSPQRVVITCDDMDYSTETSILNANGHVKVHFVQEETTLDTDHLVYDKRSNHMSAVGNVVINKQGIQVFGESINVDLNEENALIDKPLSKLSKISISADKGYVYQNKVIQEKGRLTVDSHIPIRLTPRGKSPKLGNMMLDEDDMSQLDDIVGESQYKVKVSNIIINSDKRLESIEIRKAQVYRGDKKLFTLPWIRLYTNKNHDFVDGDFPEIGSRSQLGMYIGPGWVIKLPYGSILKIAPIATYKKKFGIGGFARFLSGTNRTEVGYGTSHSKFIMRGIQELDDNLQLRYAVNDNMNEWFLGARKPNYGANLVFHKSYNHKDFILKGMDMKFTQDASFGLFKDFGHDKQYKKLEGRGITTIRGRYMAEVEQILLSHRDPQKLISAYLSIVGQGSAALYGNGNTQFIGRIGPRIHTQYKRWMQDIGYFMAAYDDNTPIPVFDAYRYGKSNAYVREYLRICKYLTLSWFGSLTFSDDRWNNSIFQECAFFVSVGPDDLKLNFGYDVFRENAYVSFSVALDPKGTVVDYDRLEIKNPENFNMKKKDNYYMADSKPEAKKQEPVGKLKQAIVEDMSELDAENDEL